MALPWLLVLELLMYSSCFVCGIITAASVTISQGSFGGKCMLYGSVYLNNTSNTISVLASSSLSLCYFVSAISVCVAVFCFSLALYWVYIACFDGEVKREKLWMNVTLGLSGIFLFFLLVTGCILKIGRDRLCDSVLRTNVTKCEEAQDKSWSSPISGSQFYSRLHSAEIAVWVNFFFWMIIAGLVLVQRNKRLETQLGGPEPSVTPSETEPFFNRPGRP